MTLGTEGNQNVQAAKVLADIVENLDSSKDYIKRDEITIARLTEDRALSFLTNARLSEYQSNIIRRVLEENCPLYHNYDSKINVLHYCDKFEFVQETTEIFQNKANKDKLRLYKVQTW